MGEPPLPKISVHKFSSCDGCQLQLLSLEDELLELTGHVELSFFIEAQSKNRSGPWDVALVEGSITTPHERERIQEVRRQSKSLISIGACAMTGGIQALRNWSEPGAWTGIVYAHPEYIESLAQSTPISEHVTVDYELRGCPVNKLQLLEVLSALLQGRSPQIASHSICLDCKRSGITCVTVARGTPCLGPVTHTGCGALCPRFGRGCFGCYGPSDSSRPDVLASRLESAGAAPDEILRMFRGISGNAPPFRAVSDRVQEKSR